MKIRYGKWSMSVAAIAVLTGSLGMTSYSAIGRREAPRPPRGPMRSHAHGYPGDPRQLQHPDYPAIEGAKTPHLVPDVAAFSLFLASVPPPTDDPRGRASRLAFFRHVIRAGEAVKACVDPKAPCDAADVSDVDMAALAQALSPHEREFRTLTLDLRSRAIAPRDADARRAAIVRGLMTAAASDGRTATRIRNYVTGPFKKTIKIFSLPSAKGGRP